MLACFICKGCGLFIFQKGQQRLIPKRKVICWWIRPLGGFFLQSLKVINWKKPVFFVLSEPAKSTKLIFDKITFSEDSTRLLISKWRVKTQWDLEEALFSLCSEIVLLVSPSKSIPSASSSVSQRLIKRPLTTIKPGNLNLLGLPLLSS